MRKFLNDFRFSLALIGLLVLQVLNVCWIATPITVIGLAASVMLTVRTIWIDLDILRIQASIDRMNRS